MEIDSDGMVLNAPVHEMIPSPVALQPSLLDSEVI